jgi:hypothetical protein
MGDRARAVLAFTPAHDFSGQQELNTIVCRIAVDADVPLKKLHVAIKSYLNESDVRYYRDQIRNFIAMMNIDLQMIVVCVDIHLSTP